MLRPEPLARPKGHLVLAGLLATAVLLTGLRWSAEVAPLHWWTAATAPNPSSPADLVFHFSLLPRAVTALLAGAGLGLAGALFQQALRNPLASPTTLGAEAGGQLALTLAAVLAPAWLAGGREAITLLGAGAAVLVVFGASARSGFSSIVLILAGLVTGLFCAALSVALRLLNQEFVSVLFLWGGGSLAQQDWSAPTMLAPRLAGLALMCWTIRRPLAMLHLDDASARSVGLPVGTVRAGALVLGVLATTAVTASVGVIGFLGLAAPQIARLAGARTLSARLVAAPLTGALLLACVDALVGLLETRGVADLPTGAATALIGAPLLVVLLPRLRLSAAPTPELGLKPARARAGPRLALLAAVLALALVAALAIGKNGGGPLSNWHVAGLSEMRAVLPWRGPRTFVALLAGAMLGAAGSLLQRLTGNPLASPEVLGIGTGAAFGLIVALLVAGAPGPGVQNLAGALGALGALAGVLAVGQRSRFAPDHILLTGLALSALLDVVVVAFLALGDPRATLVLSWIAGSTYRAGWNTVVPAALAAGLLIPVALLLRRWLDFLPLGPAAALSLGVPLGRARLAVMGLAALLTAGAVLATGPLTFVGLVGPHLARLLGLRRAVAQVLGAALLGAALMVTADLLARTVIAPRQVPAGLVAALIGLPYLAIQLGWGRPGQS